MHFASHKPELSFDNLEPSVLETARYNYGLMQGPDFQGTLFGESIGGHPRGSEVIDGRRYIAAGVNGVISMDTGKIVMFGNNESVAAQASEDATVGAFGIRIGLHIGEMGIIFRVLSVETKQETPKQALLALIAGAVLLNQALSERKASLY